MRGVPYSMFQSHTSQKRRYVDNSLAIASFDKRYESPGDERGTGNVGHHSRHKVLSI